MLNDSPMAPLAAYNHSVKLGIALSPLYSFLPANYRAPQDESRFLGRGLPKQGVYGPLHSGVTCKQPCTPRQVQTLLNP